MILTLLLNIDSLISAPYIIPTVTLFSTINNHSPTIASYYTLFFSPLCSLCCAICVSELNVILFTHLTFLIV